MNNAKYEAERREVLMNTLGRHQEMYDALKTQTVTGVDASHRHSSALQKVELLINKYKHILDL